MAAQAGAAIEPAPYAEMPEGVLPTQHDAAHLGIRPTTDGSVAHEAAWWPPIKIGGRELARHLQ